MIILKITKKEGWRRAWGWVLSRKYIFGKTIARGGGGRGGRGSKGFLVLLFYHFTIHSFFNFVHRHLPLIHGRTKVIPLPLASTLLH